MHDMKSKRKMEVGGANSVVMSLISRVKREAPGCRATVNRCINVFGCCSSAGGPTAAEWARDDEA